VYGAVNGEPTNTTIPAPKADTWYTIGAGIFAPQVEFGYYPGVEESRPVVERRQCLAVSPSVVTGQMTVRLQPFGTSRPVVEIHDATGNVIRSLICTAGADGLATATWNREDDRGRLVPEGVYFCRYAAAGVVAVRKVLVAH
jgi:FlgD Ig-like domain